MARTSKPAACSTATSLLQLEASAQPPWTRTTVGFACPGARHVASRCTSADFVGGLWAACALGRAWPAEITANVAATIARAAHTIRRRRRGCRISLLSCAALPSIIPTIDHLRDAGSVGEESSDGRGDLTGVRLECEVARVEQPDISVRDIAL